MKRKPSQSEHKVEARRLPRRRGSGTAGPARTATVTARATGRAPRASAGRVPDSARAVPWWSRKSCPNSRRSNRCSTPRRGMRAAEKRGRDAHGRDGGATSTRATLLAALMAFKKGDFSARLPIDLEGIDGKIADAFNDVIEHERAHGRGARAAQPRRR